MAGNLFESPSSEIESTKVEISDYIQNHIKIEDNGVKAALSSYVAEVLTTGKAVVRIIGENGVENFVREKQREPNDDDLKNLKYTILYNICLGINLAHGNKGFESDDTQDNRNLIETHLKEPEIIMGMILLDAVAADKSNFVKFFSPDDPKNITSITFKALADSNPHLNEETHESRLKILADQLDLRSLRNENN